MKSASDNLFTWDEFTQGELKSLAASDVLEYRLICSICHQHTTRQYTLHAKCRETTTNTFICDTCTFSLSTMIEREPERLMIHARALIIVPDHLLDQWCDLMQDIEPNALHYRTWTGTYTTTHISIHP
jgi:N12 class adenine-specific DNA methylase